MSGIAQPISFESSIEKLGSNVVAVHRYADHHRYNRQEILQIFKDARNKGADYIITTEKDAVRIPKIEQQDVPEFIPILFLKISIDIISSQENFHDCVARICFA